MRAPDPVQLALTTPWGPRPYLHVQLRSAQPSQRATNDWWLYFWKAWSLTTGGGSLWWWPIITTRLRRDTPSAGCRTSGGVGGGGLGWGDRFVTGVPLENEVSVFRTSNPRTQHTPRPPLAERQVADEPGLIIAL